MSSTSSKRVSHSKEKVLWDMIKKPVKIVYSLMTKSMGQKEFVGLFKYCYPNLWQEVENFHEDMRVWNEARLNKKESQIYSFNSATEFLDAKSQAYYKSAKLKKGIHDLEEDRLNIIKHIRRESISKYSKSQGKKVIRERYLQHISPGYIGSLIAEYYSIRKRNTLDIDTRYLIVHELAKYKCDETIRFLEQLVRCEKNRPLQHYAWECLNQFGVRGVHKGRRQGQKLSQTKGYTPISTPQELLQAIYNSPLEQMKEYDIFLSHSYQDKVKLLELKDLLNRKDLNVFLDWVNDKDELQRQLACKETAAVIAERMQSCKAVLYVHTESCLTSKWTPWELGFAYARKKKVCVLDLTDGGERPEYLELYDKIIIKNDDISVIDHNANKQSIEDWLNS